MFKFENEYKISFDPNKHRYSITDPNPILGVQDVASWTQVLGILDKSDQLLPWAVKCATNYIDQTTQEIGLPKTTDQLNELLASARKEWRKVRDEAGDIGSEVHGIIERYIKYGRDTIGELREEVQNAFLAFLEWEKVMNVQWVTSECQVYNSVYGVAGTFDAIGKIGDHHYLIDFKSSKGFYDTFPLQLGGYLSCLKEYDTPFKVERAGILRLDKLTGVPEWKEYGNLEHYMDIAINMAELFYMLKKRRLKNNRFVKMYHE